MTVPYCLYSTEIPNYGGGHYELRKVKNMVGRLGLGAPKCTATEAIRGGMGSALPQDYYHT